MKYADIWREISSPALEIPKAFVDATPLPKMNTSAGMLEQSVPLCMMAGFAIGRYKRPESMANALPPYAVVRSGNTVTAEMVAEQQRIVMQAILSDDTILLKGVSKEDGMPPVEIPDHGYARCFTALLALTPLVNQYQIDRNEAELFSGSAEFTADDAMAVSRVKTLTSPSHKNITVEWGGMMEEALFSSPIVGTMLNSNMDAPLYLEGDATLTFCPGLTLGEAKKSFSQFTSARKWTEREKSMIPQMPEDAPIMPEVYDICESIIATSKSVNPWRNLMWRGETGCGKTFGCRQVAYCLQIPLVTIVCHPAMEAEDFRSILVPRAETNVELEDANSMPTPATQTDLPTPDEFFSLALMDTEMAEQKLFGKVSGLELEDLLAAYTKAYVSSKKPAENTGFCHILSPYMEALMKGYMVEIQEASRIRDPGVLVSLNDYERAGSRIQLLDGTVSYRHPDAICIITDNVGYAGCRKLDQSVIRRQAMIVDSKELSEEVLCARTMANTGADKSLVEKAYRMWSAARAYCAEQEITEGSVSPVELERLVQLLQMGVKPDIAFERCVISKASSDPEEQQDIRNACALLS